MTDRLKGLQVTFTKDLREDDAQAIINAIRLIRGVEDVRPVEASMEDAIVEIRTRSQIRTRIAEILFD